jgi:hypothetical protein
VVEVGQSQHFGWGRTLKCNEQKICPTFTGDGNVDTFRCRSLVEGIVMIILGFPMEVLQGCLGDLHHGQRGAGLSGGAHRLRVVFVPHR